MTDLNANVSADQEWLPLTDADSRSLADGYYTIDSENVKVENGPHPATSLSISPYNGRRAGRGIGGTTPASHLSGATLTRYYPDAVASAGGGSLTVDNTVDPPEAVTTLVAPGAVLVGDTATLPLGLSLRLLGPFRVDFDDAGLDAGTLEIGDALPSGAVLYDVRVRVITGFAPAALYTVQVSPEGQGSELLWEWYETLAPARQRFAVPTLDHKGVVTPSAPLVVGLYPDGGPPTAGALDILALIAEPA